MNFSLASILIGTRVSCVIVRARIFSKIGSGIKLHELSQRFKDI